MEPVSWAALILGAMKIFDIIASLTPTKEDDNALQRLRKVAKYVGTPVPDITERN